MFDAVFATCYASFFREKGTGKLYACGNNNDRQLGVTPTKPEGDKDRFREHYPVPCDKINDYVRRTDPGCVWVKVVGGRDHTVLLADNGERPTVYVPGS